MFIKDDKLLVEAHRMLQELANYFIIGEDDTQQNTINQDIAYGLGKIFSCNMTYMYTTNTWFRTYYKKL